MARALARLTDVQSGRTVFINPDHVLYVQEAPMNATDVYIANGTLLRVKEEINTVVAAIQGGF
jgi:uncharacterized protein YlzI (FlbEa/FlbD family)